MTYVLSFRGALRVCRRYNERVYRSRADVRATKRRGRIHQASVNSYGTSVNSRQGSVPTWLDEDAIPNALARPSTGK